MRQADAEYIAQLLLSLAQGDGQALSVAGQAIMDLVGDPTVVPTAAAKRALGSYLGALHVHTTDGADTSWSLLPQSVATIAALRASPVRAGHVVVRGYYASGDGGGGEFHWSATSVAADNGGSVILPTGHVGQGRWLRIIHTDVSVRWFGARGDGATDDYAAIMAAQAVVDGRGGTLYFPPGTYAVGQTIHVPSGCTWRGDSSYYQLSAGLKSRILLTAAADSLLHVEAQWFQLDSMVIDGGGQATKAVVYFPGTGSTWFCRFSACMFVGPVPTYGGGGGYVVRMEGNSQIDNCVFDRCLFWTTANDSAKTGTLVSVGNNTNALLNVFNKCGFWGAKYGFEIFAGGARLIGCDFGGIDTYCIRADAVELEVAECYTESTGAWFFLQLDLSGGAAPFVRQVIRNNNLNAEGMALSLNCKVPTCLEGNLFAYYAFVEPAGSGHGICRIVSRNNVIKRPEAIQAFSGSGYPSMVDESDTVLYSGAVVCPNGVRKSAAPPTTMKWEVGQRIYNSAPAVGQPKSWVCTVAGTPGTWVSEGNL